jgi:UDP-glucose 4-epimerase
MICRWIKRGTSHTRTGAGDRSRHRDHRAGSLVASSAKARAELGWQLRRLDLRDIIAYAWTFRMESADRTSTISGRQ